MDNLLNSDAKHLYELKRVGIATFFRIMKLWKVSECKQRKLLFCPPVEIFDAWRNGKSLSAINQRLLIRLSLVVGIYKDLQIVFWSSTVRADSWVSTANSKPLFAGLSPIQWMLANDNEQIKKIRDYLQKMVLERNKNF
ncbi:hypothetical protein [Undibacterium danionis]|uniref:DUF2384 domain-containing protein n=1 Tax=Undibacterium danionis TaxID=1812100 RepID=A0ABV6IG53_9BURK